MTEAKTETKTLAAKPTTTMMLSDLLRQRKESIEQLVPKHLTAERLMRVAVNCVAKTPRLQECSPTSLLQCVLVAAELGLEPGGALGQLYLVPFKGTCTAIIGYRGFLELSRRTGQLKSINAAIVYAKELENNFKVTLGDEPKITHERSMADDRGEPIGAYCVAKLHSGEIMFEVMTKKQIEAVRARSMSADKGPWVTDWEEMAKKTVFRRLAKWLPLSSEQFDKALEMDNEDFIDGETGEVVAAGVAAAAAAVDLKEKVKTSRRMLIQDVAAPVEIQEVEAVKEVAQ